MIHGLQQRLSKIGSTVERGPEPLQLFRYEAEIPGQGPASEGFIPEHQEADPVVLPLLNELEGCSFGNIYLPRSIPCDEGALHIVFHTVGEVHDQEDVTGEELLPLNGHLPLRPSQSHNQQGERQRQEKLWQALPEL